MKKIKIKNAEIEEILSGEVSKFPKYSTQIMNLANQNAQGTRPKVVGQLSDLIQEFNGNKLEDWEKWYKEQKPDAIEDATEKIFSMVQSFKDAIQKIDRMLVKEWVEDLLIIKTYVGLKFQEAVLSKVAGMINETHRLATPSEESQGIDGYIGKRPVSIKPMTYKTQMNLKETINVDMIFYEKKKDGIFVEYDFK